VNQRHSGIGMTSQRTRLRMVERLRAEGITDERVLGAMGEIPRHIFVDEALASRAYEDMALPIGFGQTISQPLIVARMTEIARNGRELGRVLEVGTGCGYQTAVLAKLARQVFTIERLQPLVPRARAHLRELKLLNVRYRHGDGYQGLPEEAPFDAIVITAAATHVPEALKEQLAPGGRIVVPLGSAEQHLVVIERSPRGFTESRLDPVRFVPLMPGIS